MKKIKILTVGGESYQITDPEAARIDDGVMDEVHTWSGKEIIDRLCPGFTKTGELVACDPVEGYPLKVVSAIEPVQEGSGDPSPDNVRPLTGHTAVRLWRGGKNLIDPVEYMKDVYNTTLDGDVFTSDFQNGGLYVNTGYGNKKTHPKGTYTATFFPVTEGATCSFFVYSAATKAQIAVKYGLKAGNASFTFTINEEFYLSVGGGKPYGMQSYKLQLEAGSVASEYEPYRGEEFTMELGQTVYGGSLNWQTGVLTVDKHWRIFTGDEAWFWTGDANNNYNGNYRPLLYITDSALFAKDRTVPCWSSHFKYETLVAINGGTNIGCYVNNDLIGIRPGLGEQVTTIEEWKEWLADQNAAGTPVQFCYELANPITVQLTPRVIPALPGVNTLWADTGNITVTGRADPVAENAMLKSRLAALEAALINT
ncbi:MAG: hypothetical protein J6A74_03890 [Oscillospiraceae bacterium]|nr:hypothetical protein [Oscillospiraceae bacterium]